MQLLHIDSSILGPGSVSRQLSADIVKKIQNLVPAVRVTYRDLVAEPLPHLTGAYLMATRDAQAEHEPAIQADLALSAKVMQEFMAADTVVIGIGFYNFTIPSQLKAWIDRILVAGQTFRYGADGLPIGMVSGKRVIVTIARGGYYGAGSPFETFEHGESYLRSAFRFIGIDEIECVMAEGLSLGPESRANALAHAQRAISELAA